MVKKLWVSFTRFFQVRQNVITQVQRIINGFYGQGMLLYVFNSKINGFADSYQLPAKKQPLD